MPLTVGVRHDPGRRDGDAADPVVLVLRVLGVAAGEEPGVGPHEVRLAHRLEDHHVEPAVVERGAVADLQAAAEGRPVAHGDEHRLHLARCPVELERVGQRLEDPQLGQGGEVVAHLPARPRHRVGPFVDLRVEAGRQDGDEVLGAGAGQVDAAGPRAHHHVGGGLRVRPGQVEVAGHVVAGAGGDDPEAGLAADECLDGEVHHPVTADDDQALDPFGDAALGQLEGLVRVVSDEAADVEAGLLEPREGDRRRPAPPAPAGGRVREEHDLSGHAASLRGRPGAGRRDARSRTPD